MGKSSCKKVWRQYDWQQLIRTSPSMESVTLDSDVLAVVSAELSPEHTVIVFANPALFTENTISNCAETALSA